MAENTIKSEDVAPKKKAPAKKAAAKKVTEKNTDKVPVPSTSGDTIVIYYESGAGYVTPSGYKFTRSNPIAEVAKEEANVLLRLSNFRLATDEEKEFYYTDREEV